MNASSLVYGGLVRLLPAFGGAADLSAVAHAKADGGALEISGIFCLPFATNQLIILLMAQGISNH